MKLKWTALSALPLMASSLPLIAMAAETSAPTDLIAFSANGSKLTGEGISEHGTGGSVSWLHHFGPDAVFGLAAERQDIADANWSFGSMQGSWSRGEGGKRFSILGEVHLGGGDDSGRNFDYSVAVLGISQSFTPKLSMQLEARQIDIDTTHGNLPKLGLAYLWTPSVLTTFSYANSIGGNLGTEIFTARIDYYGPVNLLAGIAVGQADSAVIQPGVTLPANDLRQGFAGIAKTFTRGQLQLVADYLKLGDTDKVTLVLNYTAYLGMRGK